MFALFTPMRTRYGAAVYRPYIVAVVLCFTSQVASARATHVEQTLALQVALDREGFSPGEIDGRDGPRTRLALGEFKKVAGESNRTLEVPANPLTTYTITEEDAAGPFVEALPDDMMERAKLPALSYTSLLEALAERFHSSPALLKKLNPRASWSAGESIQVPDVEPFVLPDAAAERAQSNSGTAVEVVIDGSKRSLAVRAASGEVLMYAPVTVGSINDPLPIGEWSVVVVSWNPVFNYNPELFWDADETHAKAKIRPGPNSPVGVIWIGINKEHFGLHGTPEPSTIGRTESHGCIRLTNWDATRLGRLISAGTRVTIL